MTRNRFIGLMLITSGIILNLLELENDFADFLKGAFIGAGLVLLIKGFVKPKSKN